MMKQERELRRVCDQRGFDVVARVAGEGGAGAFLAQSRVTGAQVKVYAADDNTRSRKSLEHRLRHAERPSG